MPLTKDKAPPEPEVIPSPPDAEAPDHFVPDKDHPSYDTPSGHAVAVVGAPNPDGDPDKEAKRGEKYAAEKAKVRWGY